MPYLKKLSKNIFFVTFSVLLVAFITLQLLILTNVGTKGETVTYLRRKQEEIQISNEIKRAKIRELQSNQVILETLSERVQVEPKGPRVIDPEELNISAQQ